MFNLSNPDVALIITGNLSYFLLFLSWFFNKLYIIRLVSITGWVLIILYLAINSNFPSIPVLWNFLFITINVYKLIMHYINNRKNRLNTWEKRIRKLCFNTFEIEEFKQILSLGEIKQFNPSSHEKRTLIQENILPKSIFLLTSGSLSVTSTKGLDILVKEGAFLGELSFIQDKIPYASVTAIDTCEYIEWDQHRLRKYFLTHIPIKQKFFSLFLDDIIKKLRESSA